MPCQLAINMFLLNFEKQFIAAYLRVIYVLVALSLEQQIKKKLLDPISAIQRKAVRLVTRAPYNAHTDVLFKKYQFLKFDDIAEPVYFPPPI